MGVAAPSLRPDFFHACFCDARASLPQNRTMKALLAARLRALGQSAPISFCIRFADGSELRNRVHAPEFTLHFRTIAAQWRTVLFGHIGLLEAYFTGAVEFEGDLARVFALGLAASLSAPNPLVS